MLSVSRLFHVDHVVQNRWSALSLACSMNAFQVKAKNGRFTAGGSRCRQNLKYENSRRRLADFVKKLQQKACRTCSTIIFSYSTN